MSGPIVSGWHNITGGTPSIEVDGILYKDIVDILNTLKNDKHQVITSIAILVEKDGKYQEYYFFYIFYRIYFFNKNNFRKCR